MLALIRKIVSYRIFPVGWTLLIIVLLCLPGSMVPGTGLFSIKHLDKVVHILLFGANVLFWGFYFSHKDVPPKKLQRIYMLIASNTILLGIVMEFVQRDYIPNRSFDSYDILADAAGAIIAAIYLFRWRK